MRATRTKDITNCTKGTINNCNIREGKPKAKLEICRLWMELNGKNKKLIHNLKYQPEVKVVVVILNQ